MQSIGEVRAYRKMTRRLPNGSRKLPSKGVKNHSVCLGTVTNKERVSQKILWRLQDGIGKPPNKEIRKLNPHSDFAMSEAKACQRMT